MRWRRRSGRSDGSGVRAARSRRAWAKTLTVQGIVIVVAIGQQMVVSLLQALKLNGVPHVLLLTTSRSSVGIVVAGARRLEGVAFHRPLTRHSEGGERKVRKEEPAEPNCAHRGSDPFLSS